MRAADKSGRWSAYLSPRAAGGPYSLTVSASNTVQFDDVLIGDLWMASGQSNIELPLKAYDPATQIKDAAEEIANANDDGGADRRARLKRRSCFSNSRLVSYLSWLLSLLS